MEQKTVVKGEGLIQRYKRFKRWQKVVSTLACVVVFCTTYALILPALTLESKTYCGKEEHIKHDDSCYQITEKLICGQEEAEGHSHSDDCYQVVDRLICELEESAGHKHSDSCYQDVISLTCTLEEEDGHAHSESCYDADGNLVCELPESSGHKHDDSCYTHTRELICSQTETDGHAHSKECYVSERNLICDHEESEGHKHSDECYEKVKTLICKKEIHQHDKSCYADPNADKEKSSEWMKTLNKLELNGDWRHDVLIVAKSQLGYKESTKNYILDSKGGKLGYTRYGHWYGNDYGNWCAMFVSFCLNYAGVDQNMIPYNASCQRWIDVLSDKKFGLYRDNESYTPKPGDLIFFDWDKYKVESDRHSEHIGLVYELIYDKDKLVKIKTIEGNANDSVRYMTYKANDDRIMGYGVLPENPDPKVVGNPKDPIDLTASLNEDEKLEASGDTELEDPEAETMTGEETVDQIVRSYEGEDFLVTVTYGQEAQIPEEAELVVKEVLKDSEEYALLCGQAATALEVENPMNSDKAAPRKIEEFYQESSSENDENDINHEPEIIESIVFARFFDIGFMIGADKIEPQAAVNIAISYTEKVEIAEDSQVAAVHFAEDGIEILEVETSLAEENPVIEESEKESDTPSEETTETEAPSEEETTTSEITEAEFSDSEVMINEVNTFTFTQESFSITGTVVTGATISTGEYIIYAQVNGRYYALPRSGAPVEVSVSNGVVTCDDDTRTDIIWNLEKIENNLMYISNGSGADKVYLSLTGEAEGYIGWVGYITHLTSNTEAGVRYQAYNNNVFYLSTSEYILNVYNNTFAGSADQNFRTGMYFASYVAPPEEGGDDEIQSNYYQKVSTVQAGHEYLIVSVEGNYGLTATSNTAVGATPLKLIPVKGNPGIYQIDGVGENMLWNFPGATGGSTATTYVKVHGNNNNLRLSSANGYGLALDDSNRMNNYSNLLTYNSAINSWTIRRSGNNYVAYLSVNNGSFNRNENTSYTNNMLILEKVDKPTIPPDPTGTGTESSSGSQELDKPKYPAYVEPSDEKEVDIGLMNERGQAVPGIKGTAYSDKATSQLENQFDGVPAEDGKVLADKSVVYQGDDYDAFSKYPADSFGVTLSLLAQEYPLEDIKHVPTPIDVVFVLDVSGSMQNATASGESRRQALVNAVNDSMGQIFKEHEENRVGVVVYSSGSWDLLDIDHYSPGNNGQYLTLTTGNNGGNVYSATNLKDSNGNIVTRRTDSEQQKGTYTQAGIAQGAAMFERVKETTYTTTIGLGNTERTVTVERQPIIILLSDGDPTHCTSNYMDVLSGPHYGNGTYPSDNANNNNGIQGYYTILSANYYKQMVGIKYNVPAKFFTIGMGINATGTADFSNASATGDHYKRAVLNPSDDAIEELTEQGKNQAITATRLRNLLNNNVNDQYISVGSNTYPAIGTTNTKVPVLKNPYSDYSYANDAYFGNITEDELKGIFSKIIEDSLPYKEYGFILVKRSSAEITDPIGEGMEITSELVLNYGGINYSPTSSSTTEIPDPNNQNKKLRVTTYTYNYMYEANDGRGVKSDLSQIKVTVTEDADKHQTVNLDVPDNVLPVYAPCEVVGNNWYYEALPVRLIYQVGLTEESKEAIRFMESGENPNFYTNYYNPDSREQGAYGTIRPQVDNPYFKVDDPDTEKDETGPYEDYNRPKDNNITNTASDSAYVRRGTEKYLDDDADVIHNYLGNNGKLAFSLETTDITLNKTNMAGKLITGSSAQFILSEYQELTDEEIQMAEDLQNLLLEKRRELNKNSFTDNEVISLSVEEYARNLNDQERARYYMELYGEDLSRQYKETYKKELADQTDQVVIAYYKELYGNNRTDAELDAELVDDFNMKEIQMLNRFRSIMLPQYQERFGKDDLTDEERAKYYLEVDGDNLIRQYQEKYSKDLTKQDDTVVIDFYKELYGKDLTDQELIDEYLTVKYLTYEKLLKKIISYETQNGQVTMQNLVIGKTYYLKETKAPDGYLTIPEDISFKIEEVSGELKITGIPTGDAYCKPSVVKNGDQIELSIQVSDPDGYVLPETGGPGTKFYYTLGTLLMIGALMYGFSLRRKRERRYP